MQRTIQVVFAQLLFVQPLTLDAMFVGETD